MSSTYDVVIVGAGAAGIGMAITLQRIPNLSFTVLEANRIGESFRRWPKQTRFITPSFHSTSFGLADLNAVDEFSSPAIHAGAEHLSGDQYADYLSFVAEEYDLPIEQYCKVDEVTNNKADGFDLSTKQGDIHTRFLIWATGEYQFPDLNPFPGSNMCIHYARVTDWTDFKSERYVVIGGYESGIDASVNLIKQGHQVTLLIKKSSWEAKFPYDPSLSLSPYSRERITDALKTGRLELCFNTDVVSVEHAERSRFRINSKDGRFWEVDSPPILGTGFLSGGGTKQISDLWSWDENGKIELTEADESTRTPNLFLVGPQVKQEEIIYCFIYKFRQRFGLVASLIAECLNLDSSNVLPKSAPWSHFGNTECCEGCKC